MRFSISAAALAACVALAALTAPALAETAAEVPTNSYYDDPLTPDERSGIAQEESVSPNDGQASVPPPADDGVIPDASVEQAPATAGPVPTNEAEVVIEDSKKNDKVTASDMANCMLSWDPQTQMTRSEWEQSCRTTLQYYPERP